MTYYTTYDRRDGYEYFKDNLNLALQLQEMGWFGMKIKDAFLADKAIKDITLSDAIKILIAQGIMMGLIFSALVVIPSLIGWMALKLIGGI